MGRARCPREEGTRACGAFAPAPASFRGSCSGASGAARLGWVRLGSARLGSARLGSARLGWVRLGSAPLCSAPLRSARLGREDEGRLTSRRAWVFRSRGRRHARWQTREHALLNLRHHLPSPATQPWTGHKALKALKCAGSCHLCTLLPAVVPGRWYAQLV